MSAALVITFSPVPGTIVFFILPSYIRMISQITLTSVTPVDLFKLL